MRMFALFAALAMVGSATESAPRISRDPAAQIADDFVVAGIAAQKVAPDLVSVTEPPAALVPRAEKLGADRKGVIAALQSVITRSDRLARPRDPLSAMRLRMIRARAASLALQLEPERMKSIDTAEQVRQLYGFEPIFPALTSFDPAVAQLDRAMPGTGSLADRIEQLKARSLVPPERIEPIVRTAVTECRRRTALHLRIPKDDLTLEFPADPLIPASSVYTGNGKGKITVSSLVPADVDRLLISACHESYPGHHTHYLTLEDRLQNARRWDEYRVGFNGHEPTFAVSDAISEYGPLLAFPVDERIAYLRDVLYPLAGLKLVDEPARRAMIAARPAMVGAMSTIARDYLDHRISAETATQLLMKYRFLTRKSAEQTIKMADAFGPLLIASDQGWLAIDRAFAGKPVDEQWRLLQRMEEEPMLLADVRALAKAH